jgi:hypothetical protein
VLVPVMGIWKVLMRIGQRLVAAPVRMLRSERDGLIVPVVVVVDVRVLVLDRLVPMAMRVPFRQMQPYASCHEGACKGKLYRQLIAEQHGNQRAAEGRGRKIRAGACSTQMMTQAPAAITA